MFSLWQCLILLAATTVALSACSSPPASTELNADLKSAQSNSPVSGTSKSAAASKSIVLPHDESEFPPGAGRDMFIARCTVCHSLRYVTMQPEFTEKAWTKEVDKMRQTWGAHITDEEAKEIVGYLMLVRGKK